MIEKSITQYYVIIQSANSAIEHFPSPPSR